MKKKFNFLGKILLLICMIISQFSMPLSVLAATESSVKEGASKGSIYNPQKVSVGNSATIEDHYYANGTSYENGDVIIEKRVSKVNNDGKYNISFWIKGKETTSTKTIDTYIVFVMDRSYTMGDSNRWTNSVSAVVNISSKLSKIKF